MRGVLVVISCEICCLCSISEIGKVQPEFDYGVQCVPDCVWPTIEGNQTQYRRDPKRIWRDTRASLQMSSKISCVKVFRKNLPLPIEDDGGIQHALYPHCFRFDLFSSVLLLILASWFIYFSMTAVHSFG